MKVLVTGCSGFIGSSLVDRLLFEGHDVVGVDNFSTGRIEFLSLALQSPKFKLINGDLLNHDVINYAVNECEIVYHFAANADVRFGTQHTRKDLEQNTIVTYNILEAMRFAGVNKIVFSSTGSVYGEAEVMPTPENCPFPLQTSLYGASKVACEGLISAYCEGFGFQSWIFRFVSILGERYTHGHVFDFIAQLKADPSNLKVLGDGRQKKSYLYIQDCINAIFIAIEKSNKKVNIFNLGTDDYCEVSKSIEWLCSELNLKPRICYSGGSRGWIGDNPFIYLDTKKIQSIGWSPTLTIEESIYRTVNFLVENEWVFHSKED